MVGAVTYIHTSLNFPEMIAGPNDLAGFIDPPETGLQGKHREIHIRNVQVREQRIFLAIADIYGAFSHPVINTASPMAIPTTKPDNWPICKNQKYFKFS